MKTNGYILIHRSIMDCPYYLGEKFDRAHAWLDLLLLANFKESTVKIRGNTIQLNRSQMAHSTLQLAKRWGWSREKVSRFLNQLQNEQQIIYTKTRLTTIITIINYDKYQVLQQQNAHETLQQKKTSSTAKSKVDLTTEPTTERTTNLTRYNKYNKEYKVVYLPERAKAFKKTLRPFVDKYGVELLKSFYEYWTEPNQSGTKMRFELEKTWEVGRRLVTWAKVDAEKKIKAKSTQSQHMHILPPAN